MKKPAEKPVLQLTNTDGNAFFIMNAARRALRKAGADEEYLAKYTEEAQSGDYDNLLAVTMKYCEVE